MNPRFEMPQDYYFGGSGQAFITPPAIGILLLAAILIFVLPRRYVVVPLLIAALLLPGRVSIVAFGFNFNVYRIVLFVAWIRCLGRQEVFPRRLNSLDKVILCWAVSNAVMFSVLWGSLGAVTNRLGFLYTNLGAYFLLRSLIRDKADVVRTIKVLAVIVIVIAPFMLSEHITGHNLFSLVGSRELADVRDGSARAQGPFLHSIIAGTFGAMLMPLFVGLRWGGAWNRLILALTVLASTVMTIASASSTPLMTYLAGVLALLLWRARNRLRVFRWGIVVALVGLQMVMKAPVWFLIAHVGGATGGTGGHRALLIDNFIRHFGEWWLIGTQNNADWGYYMWDVDNAYVAAGIGGGLITFILFIAILVYAYKRIGRARRSAAKSPKDARLIWAIGAALFANTVAFFGIFYFDQAILAWYALLAMAAVTTTFVPRRSSEFQRGSADVVGEPAEPPNTQVLTPA